MVGSSDVSLAARLYGHRYCATVRFRTTGDMMMRRLMQTAAFLAIATTASAQDSRWLEVASMPGLKTTYLDTATLSRDGQVVTYWTKVKFPGNDRDQMAEYRVDCGKRIGQLLQEVDRFPNGASTVLVASPKAPHALGPGSMGEDIAMEACSRAR